MSVSSTKTVVIASIVVLVAFVAGFCAGIFADHVVRHFRGPHPPRFASRMMIERLDRHLDLTDAQRAKIEEIIQRRHRSIVGELEGANAEIERVLTPEQRRKFARMRMHLGHREGRAQRGSTR